MELTLQWHLFYCHFWIERYLFPANTDVQNQLQQFINGTLPMSAIDPTLKEYPKPVIPDLKTPTIHKILFYREENELGLNIHYEWLIEFISLSLDKFK